ncbi:aminoacyl-tRNA hydrolase [bacterium]|nr:aminoacyl-tRNA hydrolase [bacterium]
MNVAVAFLIIGLGNPGPKYAHTRHNAGFMAADELAKRYGISFSRAGSLYECGKGLIEGRPAIIIKPQTFMNLSGQAVLSALSKYRVEPSRILVLVDDCRIPLGKIRLRPSGGSGGHNGLTNIIQVLGTSDFARIRLGLGEPPQGDPIDFVLGNFPEAEWPAVKEMTALAADCAVSFITEGAERAMSSFNGR